MPTGHQGRKPCSNRCPRNSKTKIKQNTQCNKLSNQSKEKDIECSLCLKISTEREETMFDMFDKTGKVFIFNICCFYATSVVLMLMI